MIADSETSVHDEWSEDLAWQASRGAELGGALCTCEESFHSVWGAFRASGFFRGLQLDSFGIAAAISPLIHDGARILICGSADPGCLSTIGRLSGIAKPEFTVIDRCSAPLRLIEEYTRNRPVKCRTLQMDILRLDGSEQWDLVFLHYFLPFIPAHIHKALFERLASSLVAGGVMVCVNQTGEIREEGHCTELEEAWFRRARGALETSGYATFWTRSELDTILHKYAAARTKRRLRLQTAEDIKALLEVTGFRILEERSTARTFALHDKNGRVADVESATAIIAVRS